MSSALIRVDQVCTMLAQATSLEEVKDIHDRAEALRLYAKQHAESREQAQGWAEIKIRCERRMGEVLRDHPDFGRGKKSATMADFGINEHQSSRWQTIAVVPDAVFEAYIAETKAQGKDLTSAAVLHLARDFLPAKPRRTRPWCIEDDVDAIYALVERLWEHWQTPADRQRIQSTFRGLAEALNPPGPDTDAREGDHA